MSARGEKSSNNSVRRAGRPEGPGAADRTPLVKRGESLHLPPAATAAQKMAAKPEIVRARQALDVDGAKALIAQAVEDQDVGGLLDLRNRASSYEDYWATREDGRAEANRGGEVKVRAERGLGQIDSAANPHGTHNAYKKSSTGVELLPVGHTTRAAWRKIGRVADDRFDEFVKLAADDQESGITTALLIEMVRVGGAVSSTTFESYTPAVYVDAAREVMGDIDLDPASSAEANQTVGAARYFSLEDDGLSHDWHGRVWLNPPYGRSLTAAFVSKAVEEFNATRTTATVLLLNAYGFDASWFQPLWDHTLCFTDHRIRFYGGGPTFGSLFVYLGAEKPRFAGRFAEFGAVVGRVNA